MADPKEKNDKDKTGTQDDDGGCPKGQKKNVNTGKCEPVSEPKKDSDESKDGTAPAQDEEGKKYEDFARKALKSELASYGVSQEILDSTDCVDKLNAWAELKRSEPKPSTDAADDAPPRGEGYRDDDGKEEHEDEEKEHGKPKAYIDSEDEENPYPKPNYAYYGPTKNFWDVFDPPKGGVP